MYDDYHPNLLAAAIDDHLSKEEDARVLVMSPRRDCDTVGLMYGLRRMLARRWIGLIEEGTVMGEDDWGYRGDETTKVECWWGIFKRVPESDEPCPWREMFKLKPQSDSCSEAIDQTTAA